MPWQRLLSLQVLRSLMADHQLLYVLFTSYDMSIHHDVNAVHDTLNVAVEAIKVRTALLLTMDRVCRCPLARAVRLWSVLCTCTNADACIQHVHVLIL